MVHLHRIDLNVTCEHLPIAYDASINDDLKTAKLPPDCLSTYIYPHMCLDATRKYSHNYGMQE